MVDIPVRNIDAATAARLKKKAKAAGKSVNDVTREALRAAAKPSKKEIWAEIDRIRERIGPVDRYRATPLPISAKIATTAEAASMTIVDTSVAVKWVLQEEHSVEASALRSEDRGGTQGEDQGAEDLIGSPHERGDIRESSARLHS